FDRTSDKSSTATSLLGVKFSKRNDAHTRAIIPQVKTSAHQTRQQYRSTIQPDQPATMAGPTNTTSPNNAIAYPRHSIGNTINIIFINSGIIITEPLACNILPSTKIEKFGEIIAINVPKVNNDIAVRNIFRFENL